MKENEMKNIYVVINGGEGAGKGVQKELLAKIVQDYVPVREPGGTPEAEIIREVLLNADYDDKKRIEELNRVLEMNIEVLTKDYILKAIDIINEQGINGDAEAYLYAASRNESNTKIVKPAKEAGKVIIGDRSVACSMAYQGYARGIGMEKVWALNEKTIENAMPDLEIYLEISVEEANKRLANRPEKIDRLDKESEAFHEKVRQGYKEYYEKYCPYKVVFLNADDTKEQVHQKIVDTIKKEILL